MVAALAVVVLLAGTTGAVAGRLVTSHDIQDHTIQPRDLAPNSVRGSKIAPGAVTWQKSLSKSAKNIIADLVSAGPAGPAGPTGPAGPEGPAGAPSGELVSLDYYGLEGPVDEVPLDGIMELPGTRAPVEIGPGNYQVSMQGLAFSNTQVPYLLFGNPLDSTSNEIELILDLCIGDNGISESLLNGVCSTTYPLTVPVGGHLVLPSVWMPDEGGDSTVAIARVAVYSVGGDPADPIIDPPCRGADSKSCRAGERRFDHLLAQAEEGLLGKAS